MKTTPSKPNLFTRRITTSVENDIDYWVEMINEYKTIKTTARMLELYFRRELNGQDRMDKELYDLLLLALDHVHWTAIAKYIFERSKDKIITTPSEAKPLELDFEDLT